MIIEEQIKKAAEKLLGKEGEDWFYSTPEGHRNVRKVAIRCSECKITRFVVFDLRETTCNIPERITLGLLRGLYQSGVW